MQRDLSDARCQLKSANDKLNEAEQAADIVKNHFRGKICELTSRCNADVAKIVETNARILRENESLRCENRTISDKLTEVQSYMDSGSGRRYMALEEQMARTKLELARALQEKDLMEMRIGATAGEGKENFVQNKHKDRKRSALSRLNS